MKVALIGAGLSGIKAASDLAELGHEVVVFEKSRGLGGRLANRRKPWGSLDIGAQYFTVRDPGFQQQVAIWLKAAAVKIWDFSPYRVEQGQLTPSPDDTVRYIGSPLMNQLVHSLSDNFAVHFRCEISTVEKSRDGWSLLSSDGDIFSGFDWLIVSSPAEQSRALLVSCSDVMADVPESVHQPCWALGLATRGEIAEDVQGIFGDETVRWVSRLSSRPGFIKAPDIDDVWMLHFSPEWSEQQDKKTTMDIGQTGLDWLRKMMGTEIEKVAECRHYWRYANIKPIAFNQPYLVDECQQLAVIGAWCAGGRVEGAWLSAVKWVADFVEL
ncbi:NAD(P)/FAD-dependent oxidoreductase [Endozoicomonas sp. SCSIO W0465]|uniref:NAD(P)/FAD-dependent oxidoreductase n=1 Tax=Endozoicomonas sp. SCSIO W0465 TaxID=2918516 RepID=UPI00207542F3|nr:FAD-dependent oxidoreductase [Endozoicomonas sp. SCSIO W0465]USE34297.1 FAD-dependent oxidoreductase [Endozoicomonas sp. SCSIO W0465]